eukprot:gene13433-biopygen16598
MLRGAESEGSDGGGDGLG